MEVTFSLSTQKSVQTEAHETVGDIELAQDAIIERKQEEREEWGLGRLM